MAKPLRKVSSFTSLNVEFWRSVLALDFGTWFGIGFCGLRGCLKRQIHSDNCQLPGLPPVV
jgi:hypothetical protein